MDLLLFSISAPWQSGMLATEPSSSNGFLWLETRLNKTHSLATKTSAK